MDGFLFDSKSNAANRPKKVLLNVTSIAPKIAKIYMRIHNGLSASAWSYLEILFEQ